MNSLEKIAKGLGTSRAVFVGILEGKDKDYVSFSVKNQVEMPQSDDPVEKAVIDSYREVFNAQKGYFVQDIDTQYVYRRIVESIADFYRESSPLKNPTQSRLYKWLRDMSNTNYNSVSEGFIKLYRYIFKGNVIISGSDAENVIAILELMREKYENNDENSH